MVILFNDEKKKNKGGDLMTTKNYEFINLYESSFRPSTVHCKNTGLVNFYVRYLLQKCISVFEFEGLPKEWAANYFKYILFIFGYIGIINTDRYGVIPQKCGLGGYNVFMQPSFITVANPHLKGILQPIIHEQCEVIKLQPDYNSIMDLVYTYADLMALCLETSGINLLNSKLSYVFIGQNKQQLESFKKMYDSVASGEPATFIDKDLLNIDGTPNWQLFTQNVGANYITSQVLDDMKKLEDRFNTDIGIPNANTYKRERLIADEVNANNVDTQSKVMLWLDTMREDIERVNEMFNLNLSVKYRYENDPLGTSEAETNET